MNWLTPLTEKYLAKVGPRVGTMLLLMGLLWLSIGLAWAVYAVGISGFFIYRVTRAAWGGGARQIALAVIVWAFLFGSIPLARAIYRLVRQHRDQRWDSEQALSRLEKRLFAKTWRPDEREGPRERLAARALESMETEALGEPLSADLTIEERLIELDRRIPKR